MRLPVAIALAFTATPALACLPPPPGMPEPPPPTKVELAHAIARSSANIAYGIVTSELGEEPKFKVIHVYRGTLSPEQVISPQPGHNYSLQPTPCPGMVPPPPLPKGVYGVIAYSGAPVLSFIPDQILQEMFAAGLIKSARSVPGR